MFPFLNRPALVQSVLSATPESQLHGCGFARMTAVGALATILLSLGAPVLALEVDTTATLVAPAPTKDVVDTFEPAAIREGKTTISAPRYLDFSSNTVLATWNGGSLTTDELSATLALRRPAVLENVAPENYNKTPLQTWRQAVRELSYETIVYQKGLAEGITTQTPVVREAYLDARQTALNQIFFSEELAKRMPAAQEKLVREYYDKNLESQFVRPERIIVNSLQVPILEEVTVGQNETIDQIAQRVSGSVEEKWNILRGEPPYAPRLPQGKARAVVPQLEVKAGEKLLVPVKPEERKRRREIAEQLRQRLLKGEHVTTAALSITEPRVLVAMNGGLYTPEYDRISPAAAKAIREMTSNTATVTEPLDGPYGYDLYVLQARTTTNTQPFEEVRERILTAQQENQTFQQRLREDLRIEVFNELRSTHSLEINTPALERADYGGADPLTGATWIVRAKDFTLTLDDYLRELSAGDRSWGAMTPAQRIEVAKSMPAVIRQLVLMESNRQNLDSNPALQSLLKSKEIQEISKEWFRRRAKEDGDTTIGVLQEYYTKNIDRYTSRSMVTVREITRRYDPALPAAEKVASMERAKAGVAELRTEAVKSKEAFEAAARRGSASISTRSRGGLIGTVPINFRGPVVEAELLKLKVGEVTPPLIYGSEAMILRLDDFVGGVVQPFEQVGNLVLRDFANEIPKSRRENRRAEVFKEANFKIQF